MNKISVIIPILNEEANLRRCLESVKWSDEIIVVDMGSTDGSVEVCKKYRAKVFTRIPQDGNFDENRLFGMKKATGDWILKLDADEELTPELQREIQDLLKNDQNRAINGYYLKNKIYMFGKEVKHGFVKPDSNEFRLFKRNVWSYSPTRFHQQIAVSGETGILSSYYLHYNNQSISHFITKTNRYTDFDSKYFYDQKVRYSLPQIYLSFLKVFVRLFFLQKGFLDGAFGVVTCTLYSFYYFLEKLKIYELEHFKTINDKHI